MDKYIESANGAPNWRSYIDPEAAPTLQREERLVKRVGIEHWHRHRAYLLYRAEIHSDRQLSGGDCND
ncbi:hypothetical protein ACGFIU_00705 [Rhodococcus oryzae]|uniref:hypothetical protein n=1 Tax=Rhodococcus oryzae TaxID=2571143 RepID=UPI003721E75C